MAASAVVTVNERRWVPVTQERRSLVLNVRFDILDPGPQSALTFSQEIRYPPAVFASMTQAQAVVAIRDNGIAGIPSLRALAQGLLDDWNNTAGIRGVTFPISFNP